MSDTIQKQPPLDDAIYPGDLNALKALTVDADGGKSDEGILPPEQGIEQPGTTQPAPVAEEEVVFNVDGKQVKWAELPPETKKSVYDIYTNQKNFRATTTQKTQELGEERAKFESDQKEHSEQLKAYNTWNKLFNDYPHLQTLVTSFLNNDQNVVGLATQLHQGSPQTPQPGQQPGGAQQGGGYGQSLTSPSPMVQQLNQTINTLTSRLENLEKQNKDLVAGREQDVIEKETQTALATIKEKFPDLDVPQFEKYMETVLSGMNDKSALYMLVANAMIGSNAEGIVKKAQADMANNIKNGQAAAVQTGSGTPAVNLPQNVDLTGKDLEDMFEGFKEQQGIKDEEAIDTLAI